MMLVPVLVILGYPLTALRRVNELLQAERRSSDPDSSFIAELNFHLLLRDTRMIGARADELLSIATEHENIFTLNLAIFLRGWTTAATRRFEEGITEMQRSISDPAFSQSVAAALALVALAETCGNNGRAEQGLDLVDQGLTTAKQIGQRVAEAELHRLKGELLMLKDPGNVAEAEGCLRRAIAVARRQSARHF